ncbi:MAG: hypothetical protein AB7V55_02370 [Oscillospiraceae bacterium]|jgi:hypothetical protein
MELFHENGHLTDEGLRSLIDGGLSEIQSLEASEHLGFCDACLMRYTQLLDKGELLVPEQPLQKSVMQRIHRRAVRIVFSRYATVAAAAVLAVGMWLGGSAVLGGRAQQAQNAPQAAAGDAQAAAGADDVTDEETAGIGARVGAAFGNVAGGLQAFFDNMVPEAVAPEAPDPPQPERRQPRARRQEDTGQATPSNSTAPPEDDSQRRAA